MLMLTYSFYIYVFSIYHNARLKNSYGCFLVKLIKNLVEIFISAGKEKFEFLILLCPSEVEFYYFISHVFKTTQLD